MLIANLRRDPVVEEGAVLRDLDCPHRIFDALGLARDGVLHAAGFARLHGGIEFVDAVLEALVVFVEFGPIDLDLVGVSFIGDEVQFGDRSIVPVDHLLIAFEDERTLFGIDLDVVFDLCDAGLREVEISLVGALVIGPSIENRRWSHDLVEYSGVVVEPAAKRGKERGKANCREAHFGMESGEAATEIGLFPAWPDG